MGYVLPVKPRKKKMPPLILIKDKIDIDYLSKIDKKISTLAQKELNNSKLGFNNKIDYKHLDILLDLRDMFIAKEYGSDCLKDICLSEIKFYIDKLTNTLC